MRTRDIARETYSALLSNKIRTGLTMLGIVIGIGSVIAMVSIGEGAQSSIQDRIQSIGANLIQVSPGSQASVGGYQVTQSRGSAQTLKASDADAILQGVSGIQAVTPELSGRRQVTAKGTNTNVSVVGTTASYTSVRNVQIADGVFLSDEQSRIKAKVAVLGPTTAEDLFGDASAALGQVVRINGIEFKVIGVTAAKGGSGFGSQDDMVFIPLATAQQYLTGGDYVTLISAQATDASVMAQAQQDITDLLLRRHKIADAAKADFSILNQNDIVETASSITQTFTILLGAVAGISLVVGGIGIMNMMLTTVTERMREIGLRKAIGAKRRDVSLQFLAEAVALTLAGGLIGVLLGWGAAFAVSYFGILATKVSANSIILAFGVSAAIGIVFGYYPARRAAQLNPIEALRYE